MRLEDIILVTNQFSVVVKGLEKELTKLRYEVRVVDNGISALTNYDFQMTVIILYLSNTVLDDPDQVMDLYLFFDKVRDHGCGLILIDADGGREQFLKEVPGMKDYVWLERPVDIRILSKEIEKALEKIRNRSIQKKILVVDDDPVYAMMVSNWLKERYTASIVTDGMQAISFLTNTDVDLILLDYEMPVVDGPQIMQMLRNHPKTSHIPVMFLTGVRDRGSIERVVKLKPDGYILKSSTKEEIMKVLSEHFNK